VNESPILKINGKRYKIQRVKMGAYRQVMMLVDDMDNLTPEELKDDILEVVRVCFDLTKEEAEQVDTADLFPLFGKLASYVQMAFTQKAKQLPNAASPDATPGQS
jgi:hypothetical protein